MNISRFSERGGVLVWILIAVALFAALSFVMIRDGGGGTATRTMSDAQARLAATEIIAYADDLRGAVQHLLISGCQDDQLDFGNTVWVNVNGTPRHPIGHNDNAPASGCGVFSPDAGGVRPVIFPRSSFMHITLGSDQAVFGAGMIITFKLPEIGSPDKSELIYHLPHVDEKVCMAINDLLNIENNDNHPPKHISSVNAMYHSSYTTTLEIGAPDPAIIGKAAFCSTDTSTEVNDNRFYKVLIAR
ncbi:MAG: hypothetical protein WC989_07420 [Micavibrio sp.]